ncbi:hypothetical protein HanXRQr2_Chr07g0316591 [Helianthus annuus]|uniref:Low-temperature-induced 65 kDa protein n=2 Tax=Helianthus annuus TaxID=4232 RepID=A0A9K3NHK0_HELAN|nr:hypothetical protein HanXRQr2_Chr07g0316591 [Helianthus annuus]KAJ0558897.1 hypothetical protein HanIR_Chr07g0341431 [Helianthus annuus]KAJ0906485.1 hypothetical protein HanPSC8_Chr07g0305931 [Helianthus annuus]
MLSSSSYLLNTKIVDKMESQLQQTHGAHGRHYDQDPLTGHDHNEDEHHGEKKSVMKKVKEKAKKIKNTITKHGHGHHHHDEEEDDDDDEEAVEDPEVHGAPMYDSARVGQGGLYANMAQPMERPPVLAEDRYTHPVTSHGEPQHISTSHNQTHGQEVNKEKWRGKIGQSVGMEEEPFAPNPGAPNPGVTDHTYGTRHVPEPAFNRGEGHDVNKGGLRGIVGKTTRMVPDPSAPKDSLSYGSDPSNYGTKVDNPMRTGGKEAELSHLEHSFDKMGIESEPKTLDSNHPENLPRDTLTGNPSGQSSTYANKISSSASAIADKAADVIASKLGYSDQNQTTKSHESVNTQGSATDYAHMITDKVTGTLAPVYEKVVDAGSSVISKVQGSVSGTGTGTGQPQVHRGSGTSSTMEKENVNVTDKGVSVKEHLVETLKPGEEDKALSDVITHALHRGKQEESGKKAGEDHRPMGVVTESVEVRRRLGTDQRKEQHHDDPGNVVADKNMSERLADAVGSFFGGKGDAPQRSTGTSYVTDEGLSSTPTGGKK